MRLRPVWRFACIYMRIIISVLGPVRQWHAVLVSPGRDCMHKRSGLQICLEMARMGDNDYCV